MKTAVFPAFRLALSASVAACVALFAAASAGASEHAPPRPKGSSLTRIEAGLSKKEEERQERAHENKSKTKDYTKDDSDDKGVGNSGNNAGKGPPPASAEPKGPRTLVLYDAPAGTEFEKLGFAYAIMLGNLLGHFDSKVDLMPVQQYTPGKLNAYSATFYLGDYYDNPIPKSFLSDAAATTKTVVWFKYNLWQLQDPAYKFQATRGFSAPFLAGMNRVPTPADPAPGFYDTVNYKGKPFVKYYASEGGVIKADPDIGMVSIADPLKASVVVTVSNPKLDTVANPTMKKDLPYIVRSGNFWYVADMPFSFIGPRDRYLVLTDLLHDMLGIQHAESHKALVRLEDVGAMVSVQAMKKLTDYLSMRKIPIPFSIATIPLYVDGLGVYNGGVPLTVPLSQATNLKKSLNYAIAGGGEIVMHGYTHQYGAMKNPHTGVSGDDYEFWNIVANSPVAEDSTSWAHGRLMAGVKDLARNGYSQVAWEAPHYHASALSAKAASTVFNTTYQRAVYFTADKPNFVGSTVNGKTGIGKDFGVGQIFPYVINRDYYGQRVLPETLGNIEYDIRLVDGTSTYNYTPADIVGNAEYAKTVRDGYASFFFHPFWLESGLPAQVTGFPDFQKVIDGITQLGFTWVAPSKAQ